MRKLNLWMLATILALCGLSTALTSCSSDDDEVKATPIGGTELYKMWYAETTVNYTFDDGTTKQLKQVTALDFKEDGTGQEYSFYVDDNNQMKEEATSLIGASFTFVNNNGRIVITGKDYFNDVTKDLVRVANYNGSQLVFETGATSLSPATEAQKTQLEAWLPEGANGASFDNINDLWWPAIDKFNKDTWYKNNTIYLYDGKSKEDKALLGMREGYHKVALPWSKDGDIQSNLPFGFCDSMTPENGWELALNRCGYNKIANENFIFLYNKYTGILRVLYFLPDDFDAGNDHVWEVMVGDSLALRSPWRYGIPEDAKIVNKQAIGQTSQQAMVNYITPWVDALGKGGVVTPNTGWWAFDIDMSCYRPGQDISKEQIRLHMRSWDQGQVSLYSLIEGKIDGTVDLNNKIEKTGSSAGDAVNGIVKGVKAVAEVASAALSFYKGDAEGVIGGISSLAEALGIGADIGGICESGTKVTGLEGKISLGLNGTIDTKGFVTSAKTTRGIVAPTINISDFDLKNTHVGQGVWNLKRSPVIYLTHQALNCGNTMKNYFPNWKDYETTYWNPWAKQNLKTISGTGVVWCFDPTSIEVDLNEEVFPYDQIDWMQVDAICGMRLGTGSEIYDNFRKFMGIRARSIMFKNRILYANYGNFTGSGKNTDYPWRWTFDPAYKNDSKNGDILANFGYEMKDTKGMSYDVVSKMEKFDNYNVFYYGFGIKDRYIIEPQTALPVWYESSLLGPVEVNVQLTIKMKGSDRLYVYNRLYVPSIRDINELTFLLYESDLYNRIKYHQFDEKQKDHHALFDYHKNRAYEKLRVTSSINLEK